MKITKAKLKQIIQEELGNMEEVIDQAAEGRGLMPFGDWVEAILKLVPGAKKEKLSHLYDAWFEGVSPKDYAENLGPGPEFEPKHSMEMPTDPLAMGYARGEI